MQVPITAGGEGLASPGAAPCSVTGSSADTVTTKHAHDQGQSATSSGVRADGGSSNAVAIGVGVGVGVGGGMMIVAIVAGCLWFRRRKRTQKVDGDLPDYTAAEKRVPDAEGGVPQELGARNPMAEMPDSTQILELPHDNKVSELQAKEGEKGAMSPQELPGDVGQLK